MYADHAATTPLSSKALESMMPYLVNDFGNPSNAYSFSRAPKKALKQSRADIAAAIGALPSEIYFTSGGTEADNWAIRCVVPKLAKEKKRVIVSSIEHHAVIKTCQSLEDLGFEVVALPVDSNGVALPGYLESVIDQNTALVSVMLANNEIGTIQPVSSLAEIAHNFGALFHTDAVQAIGHIPVNVDDLGVDLLSASGHKFNGPKGSGFLYIRSGTPIAPVLFGGGQESGLRAGTENVAAIVGMTVALQENTADIHKVAEYLTGLSHRLISQLKDYGVDFTVNGSPNRIPGNLSLSFPGFDGEMVMHRLDLAGVSVSTGSACNSGSQAVSHVLRAIGLDEELASGTIRISLGAENTEADVDYIASCLIDILQ